MKNLPGTFENCNWSNLSEGSKIEIIHLLMLERGLSMGMNQGLLDCFHDLVEPIIDSMPEEGTNIKSRIVGWAKDRNALAIETTEKMSKVVLGETKGNA